MTDTNEAHLKRYVLIKKYIYTDREGKFEDNTHTLKISHDDKDFMCHVIK